MKSAWKEYYNQKNAGVILVTTLFIVIVSVYSLSRFLVFVEGRPGVVLDDPLFRLFNAVDLNFPVFALIYISLIWCLVYLAKYHPQDFVLALQTYSLLIVVRMAMMYVVPLAPPTGTIDLQDPLVFIVGTGKKITKDLFFSGHTSILFLMFLATRKPLLRYIFLANTILVGLFVVFQKAHYTVDVMVAPFIAYGCFKLVSILNSKYLFKK